jgi:hypothetical protein
VKIGVPLLLNKKPIEKGSFKSNIRMEKGYNELPQRAVFKYKATIFTRRLAFFNEILTSLPWLLCINLSSLFFVRVLYGSGAALFPQHILARPATRRLFSSQT